MNDKTKHSASDTKLVTSGRHADQHAGAVNPPVFRASTILHPDLETLESKGQRYTYGRRGTPTTDAFAEAMTALEGGAGTVLLPSGLAAVTTAILALTASGDHILLTESCYGPTRAFCHGLLRRFGVDFTIFDPLIGADIEKLIRPDTKLIFLESPGSLTFDVQDVPAIASIARARGIKTALDNTWATPLYFKPLAHGVDVSIHAATKYISGHSDCLLGTITANAATWDAVLDTHGRLGMSVSGDDAYLGQRGLRSLSPRLQRHRETAEKLIAWLAQRPEVSRILYPAHPRDPGYALWQRDFTGATGLFGLELVPAPKAALSAFFRGFSLFGIGWSWGGYESLIVPAHAHRENQPGNGERVRISAGFEAPEDLIADLARAFDRFNAARPKA
ncbi:MAG TPA: cystathionine beta-lyase [Micropepsaceae bacterium]|nr:cystathionine beta-lyase [Micropepsaceae bacterium]